MLSGGTLRLVFYSSSYLIDRSKISRCAVRSARKVLVGKAGHHESRLNYQQSQTQKRREGTDMAPKVRQSTVGNLASIPPRNADEAQVAATLAESN